MYCKLHASNSKRPIGYCSNSQRKMNGGSLGLLAGAQTITFKRKT